MDTASSRFTFTVPASKAGVRLDVYLSECLEEACSRSYAAQVIQQGAVTVNGKACKPSYRLRPEDRVSGQLPEATPSAFLPEPMDLDILFEDRDLMVIDKPPGLVVHPAPGHATGTLVNGLLYHCPDLAAFQGEIRPGIVHRLDKDTSGVMVIAKNPSSHEHLASQFKRRSISKTYLAIVSGKVKRSTGEIHLPIGRHPTARKQMSTRATRARVAETHFHVRERFAEATLLELILKTGRTHQIRVHCAAMHHPVMGDAIYGGRKQLALHRKPGPGQPAAPKISRQMLHAWRLGFRHPKSDQWREFEAPVPGDMQCLLEWLRGLSAP